MDYEKMIDENGARLVAFGRWQEKQVCSCYHLA